MDSRKIGVLLDIVEAGSMMKVADDLGYTPSGLAHMMDAVEQELGIAVLDRTNRGVKLNAAGEQLLPLLKKYVAINERILDEARKLEQGAALSLRVGAYTSIANHWLGPIITGFARSHPGFEINLMTLSTSECYEGLAGGSLDLAFCCRRGTERCEFLPLKDDELFAIFPPDANVGRDDFPLKALEGKPFIMPSQGSDEEVTAALAANKVKPQILAAATEDSVVIHMVASGIGTSMLSELVLTGHEAEVQRRQLSPRLYRHLGIAYRKEALSDLARAFVEFTEATLTDPS